MNNAVLQILVSKLSLSALPLTSMLSLYSKYSHAYMTIIINVYILFTVLCTQGSWISDVTVK